MKNAIKNAVEKYQCPGCVSGSDIKCFEERIVGVGCGKHIAGTIIREIGPIYLGMIKGFNRLGCFNGMIPRIFETYDNSNEYDVYNIPVWKYLTPDGHTLVRGIMPRKNEPFLDIFLENCMDKINCCEVTNEMIDYMD